MTDAGIMSAINDNDTFSIWLNDRRILPKRERLKTIYDREFLLERGSKLYQNRTRAITKYYKESTGVQNVGDVSLQSCRALLQELRTLIEYPYKNKFHELIAECTEMVDMPIIDPLWFSNDSMKLQIFLEASESLIVIHGNHLSRKIDPSQTQSSFNDTLSYKNNLFAIYQNIGFFAVNESLNVFNMEKLDDFGTANAIPDLVLHLPSWLREVFTACHQIPHYNTCHSINYMKVLSLFESPVLCFCTDSNLVVVLPIDRIIEALLSQDQKPSTTKHLKNCCDLSSVAILEVSDSCWSVDIFSNNNVAYLAAGHNGHEICIFKCFRTPDESYTWSMIDRIACTHNIPCIKFILQRTTTSPDDATENLILAVCSIFGDLSIYLVRDNKNSGEVSHHLVDCSFFGEFCWTVTSLTSDDFGLVENLSLLNHNLNEEDNLGIQLSIIRDTKLLNGSSNSWKFTESFCSGHLTTQIPVPTLGNMRLQSNNELGHDSSPHAHSENSYGEIFGNFQRNLWHNGTEGSFNKFTFVNDINKRAEHFLRSYMFEEECTVSPSRTMKYDDQVLNKILEEKLSPKLFVPNPVKLPFESGSSLQTSLLHYITESKKSSAFHQLVSITPIPSSLYFKETQLNSLVLGSKIEQDQDGVIPSFPSDITDTSYNIETDEDTGTQDSTSPNLQFSDLDEDDPMEANRTRSAQQKSWSVHNHCINVKKLITLLSNRFSSELEKKMFDDARDRYLLLTTDKNIYLVNQYPLLVTSFTREAIFPTKSFELCELSRIILSLDRLNLVCHIKELQCIVVASQLGMLSLLRLTKINGTCSFRQEYIYGFQYQKSGGQCLLAPIFVGLDDSCTGDNVKFPLFNITGIDYQIVNRLNTNGIEPCALVYVTTRSEIHRFKISKFEIHQLSRHLAQQV